MEVGIPRIDLDFNEIGTCASQGKRGIGVSDLMTVIAEAKTLAAFAGIPKESHN